MAVGAPGPAGDVVKLQVKVVVRKDLENAILRSQLMVAWIVLEMIWRQELVILIKVDSAGNEKPP